ncbi:hypothetical protein GGR14_000202 [Butyricimonas faecihominis]|uniref:Uncharacterized protein n=1 Tax=Butyricimonas faecihominis TaxID=1472416 RepID=A0A7W6MX36_9BACT|nr:hypothetical protein [Butyricimonas faecihominis]
MNQGGEGAKVIPVYSFRSSRTMWTSCCEVSQGLDLIIFAEKISLFTIVG